MPERPQLPPFPILEFDPAPTAILEPREVIEPSDVPERCVICFFREVIAGLVDPGRARVVAESRSEIGIHPLYEMDFKGQRLAFFHPGIGSPLAAGLLEEVIAHGCRKFIACGGAGVLDRALAVGHLIVPTTAIRDEGTSYHYLPPSREVAANPWLLRLSSVYCSVIRSSTCWRRPGLRMPFTAKPPPGQPPCVRRAA